MSREVNTSLDTILMFLRTCLNFRIFRSQGNDVPMSSCLQGIPTAYCQVMLTCTGPEVQEVELIESQILCASHVV